MTVQRKSSATDVASALDMSRSTVDRYARLGTIPYSDAPGGRKYDLDEVKDALKQEAQRPVAPPAGDRGPLRRIIDAVDLDAWAKRDEAARELPELVSLLVDGSGAKVVRKEFPIGQGVNLPEWDGVLEAETGTEHVPAGVSVWELGRGEDVKRKADEDYATRTADPLNLDREQTVFVFVTARSWVRKMSWEAEKNQEGKWKKVRAYDAHTLQDWLDAAPTAAARAATLLGRDPYGKRDLASAWAHWSSRTEPSMPAAGITSGRADQVALLRAWADAEPSALWVAADTADEACGFILASMADAPAPERVAIESRTLVVYDVGTWMRLLERAGTGHPHLLIAAFADPPVARAVADGHHVVAAVDASVTTKDLRIELPRVRRFGMYQALIQAGVSHHEAEKLALLARRSMTVLRRRCAVDASAKPAWAQPGSGQDRLPVVLAGKWLEDPSLDAERAPAHPGDQRVLSDLTGVPYPQISAQCAQWSAEPDAVVRRQGPLWFCVSKDDAWELLSGLLTTDLMRRFRTATLTVLGVTDPRYDLPVPERRPPWIHTVMPEYSYQLRAGLAESLAVFATRSGKAVVPGGLTGAQFANEVVGTLLRSANADPTAHLWRSLGDVLPLLAEAAPDEFLDALSDARDDGLLQALFDPESEALPAGWPGHIQLLWALETLAWSSGYFARATRALADLAALDPGGRWTSRPDVSLSRIFHLAAPQTSAASSARLRALDTLRSSTPATGWKLMVDLLAGRAQRPDDSAEPKWREWKPDSGPEPTHDEAEQHVHDLLERVIEDVGYDGTRWAAAIAQVVQLPAGARGRLLLALAQIDPDTLPDDDRLAIAGALADIVHNHRRYPHTPWAAHSDVLNPIETQLDRFRSEGEDSDEAWLFARHVEIGPWNGEDPDLEQHAIEDRRRTAVSALLARQGVSGLISLARSCEWPWQLGRSAGSEAGGIQGEMLVLLDAPEQALHSLASGYLRERFSTLAWPWAEQLLREAEQWPAVRAAALLRCLPSESATFDAAARLGPETDRAYWRSIDDLRIRDDLTRQRAARSLAQHGRHEDAIALLAISASGADPAAGPAGDLVADELRALVGGPIRDPTRFIRDATTLISYLEEHTGTEHGILVELEWAYLPLYADLQVRPRILHDHLARDPEFFAKAIGAAYLAEGEEPRASLDDEARYRGHCALALLNSWRTVPGSLPGPGPLLGQWVDQARHLLRTRGLLKPGDRHIGQTLFYATTTDADRWPPLEVCSLIEQAHSPSLEDGFATEALFGLGAASRGVGGGSEKLQAERYRAIVEAADGNHERTRRLLRKIANQWDSTAVREDLYAEMLEDSGM